MGLKGTRSLPVIAWYRKPGPALALTISRLESSHVISDERNIGSAENDDNHHHENREKRQASPDPATEIFFPIAEARHLADILRRVPPVQGGVLFLKSFY